MPNLTDILLATVWLVWFFFFLPMFQLARLITDALIGHDEKTTVRWKATLAVSLVFVYLAYLALGQAMIEIPRNFTPTAAFPKEASGIGILAGAILYGTLTARSTWQRRKRRASQRER
jgi:hypothetical protein